LFLGSYHRRFFLPIDNFIFSCLGKITPSLITLECVRPALPSERRVCFTGSRFCFVFMLLVQRSFAVVAFGLLISINFCLFIYVFLFACLFVYVFNYLINYFLNFSPLSSFSALHFRHSALIPVCSPCSLTSLHG
jgi:hypothetical protein